MKNVKKILEGRILFSLEKMVNRSTNRIGNLEDISIEVGKLQFRFQELRISLNKIFMSSPSKMLKKTES
jgi:hypothetical protein